MFSDIVEAYLARGGAAAACCSAAGTGPPTAECAATAETTCAFAIDATRTYRVEQAKDDANSALVYVDLVGPHGKGTCTFALGMFGSTHNKHRGIRILNGTCRAITP
jgi:hypothetical protein